MKLDLQKYLEEFPQCDPFESYVWGKRLVHRKRIRQYIRDGKLCTEPADPSYSRAKHEKRIAYLAVRGWSDAIEIDVGCPGLPGGFVDFPTLDGNHRIAAALFRGDPYIEANCSGDIEFFEQFRWTE